jgi:hypothetical protein
MKKLLVILGIVTLFICVGLSGCNQDSNTINSEKNKFVGTWKGNETFIYEFFSDGTLNVTNNNGYYEIKGGRLVLTFSDGFVETFNYIFSNNDKTLTLTPTDIGQQLVLYKQ